MSNRMNKLFAVLALACLFVQIVGAPVYAGQNVSDDDVKRAIIRQSLESYSGNCPCPYNSDRAGRACGKRSAYSKPGGYEPICYPDDVTPAMIEEYRKQHKLEEPERNQPC